MQNEKRKYFFFFKQKNEKMSNKNSKKKAKPRQHFATSSSSPLVRLFWLDDLCRSHPHVVCTMSQWGRITLWDAAADGNVDLVKRRLKMELSKINAQDSQGKTALHEASRQPFLSPLLKALTHHHDTISLSQMEPCGSCPTPY